MKKVMFVLMAVAVGLFAAVYGNNSGIKSYFPKTAEVMQATMPKVIADKFKPKFKEGDCVAWVYEDEFEKSSTYFYIAKVGKTSYLMYQVFTDTGGAYINYRIGKNAEKFGSVESQYVKADCPE